MDLLKHILLGFIIALSAGVEAQIVGREGQEVPSEYSKKELRQRDTARRQPTLGLDEFTTYFGGGVVFSNRTLEPNDYPFGKPIGDRVNETGGTFYSVNIGLRNRVNEWFSYDLGLAYVTAGENYDFQSQINDSSFSYTTRYSYLSLPIQCLFTYGKDLRVFAGGGIQPQFLVDYQQKQEFTDAENVSGTAKIGKLDHANGFQLAALVSAGAQLKIARSVSFYVMPQYTWHITPTTGEQSTFRHRLQYFNLQFGFAIHFLQ